MNERLTLSELEEVAGGAGSRKSHTHKAGSPQTAFQYNGHSYMKAQCYTCYQYVCWMDKTVISEDEFWAAYDKFMENPWGN